MKLNSTVLAISLIALFFSSCNSESNKNVIIERTAFHASLMDSIYSDLRPAIETFEINAEQTQELKSKNGIEVLIPANTFVDDQGNLVTGKVEIEIVEANDLKDFISCGLQTLSDDRLLESAGMLYIDAKSNRKSLRIADDQKISISMSMMRAGSGFEMFTGAYNEQGAINWKEDKSTDKDYLISFPADILYPNFGHSDLHYFHYGLFGADTTKYDPRHEKYANTFIQTREFKNRLWAISNATYLISSLLNKDLPPNDLEEFKFDNKLYDLYFTNLDLDIEVLDSMANSIVEDFMANPEYIAYRQSKLDKNIRISFWWLFTGDEEEYDYWLTIGLDGAKGNVPDFETHGIDLSSKNAFDQLISKGVSQNKAQTILNIEKERTAHINEINRIREAHEKRQKMIDFVQKTVFSTSNLGWINCDRFLDDPRAGEAEILVSIPSEEEFEYTDCSLIIPSMNVKLSAYIKDANLYTFTRDSSIYSKLPIGEEAVIVGVSIKENNSYFAYEKIKIEDNTAVTLNLTQVDKNDLSTLFENALTSN